MTTIRKPFHIFVAFAVILGLRSLSVSFENGDGDAYAASKYTR
jgi:hypothetical protein